MDDVHAQYEAIQTELQTLDAVWRQQQALVQEIIALRKGCWKKLTLKTAKSRASGCG